MEMVHFIPPSERHLALLAAQNDSGCVLFSGSGGTGKSAIARWVHNQSPRSTKNFIIKHAQTPLAQDLLAAEGGTLFIPEIVDLPLGEQRVLLDYLETHSIPHPDSPTSMRRMLHTRVMAATEHDLDKRAQGGLFNLALLQVLGQHRITMPRLCDRPDEFEDIVLELIREIGRELRKNHLRALSPEAWKKLKHYDWPGNLRELRNVLRMSVLAAQKDQIEAQDIPDLELRRIDFRATRDEFERIYLLELFSQHSGNLEMLGQITRMDPATLLEKLRLHGIAIPIHSAN